MLFWGVSDPEKVRMSAAKCKVWACQTCFSMERKEREGNQLRSCCLVFCLSAWRGLTWLALPCRDWTWLDLAWLSLTWLALICIGLRWLTYVALTGLSLTCLDVARVGLTELDWACLCLTWLDVPWLGLRWLDFPWLGGTVLHWSWPETLLVPKVNEFEFQKRGLWLYLA